MKLKKLSLAIGTILLAAAPVSYAVEQSLLTTIQSRVSAIETKMIDWRRDIHQHPELSNQEHRTAKLVAEHLRKLGLEVTTGIGGTGVMGAQGRQAGQGRRLARRHGCPAGQGAA